MNRLFSIIAFIIIMHNASFSQANAKIPISNFKGFEHLLHLSTDTVYVLNFWATWCIPCRKELPEFEKIAQTYKNEKVKILLVSLDFPAQIDKELIPFLKNNNITSNVYLLNDPNSNAWIDKVDASWSGSIPATLIYKRNNRRFYENELAYDFLNRTVREFLNN
jgi:thiol-disulfide isomerase/thioredoxin